MSWASWTLGDLCQALGSKGEAGLLLWGWGGRYNRTRAGRASVPRQTSMQILVPLLTSA